MAYQGLVTPEMEEEFNRSSVVEMAPDFWRLEGYSGYPFKEKKSSPNVYIMRDEDTLYLLDSGLYAVYRERILKLFQKYFDEGIKKLILLHSHCHFDHVANNDIILEANFPEVRILIPEPELDVIDLKRNMLGDQEELEEYYDPYSFEFWINGDEMDDLLRGVRTMAERAECLPLDSQVKKRIGDIELVGWEVGRFFAIHDGSQTPGHISIYDPKYKILLVGDLTLEINPPFMHSSLQASIDILGKFIRIVEQGHVEQIADSHRSAIFSPAIYEGCKVESLHPVMFTPIARGKDECIQFLRVFEFYYTQLKDETIIAHARLGEATVPEIVEELKKSINPAVRNKLAFSYPNRPSRIGVLVARVLKETKAVSRKENDKILFTPGNV